MGEWSDYFEDFPDENPANHRCDVDNAMERRVQKEATYSAAALLKNEEIRKQRDFEQQQAQETRQRKRDQAQSDLHRSIGALMEAYGWLDVHIGLRLKHHFDSDPEVHALLNPKSPMKLRLDCLNKLVQNTSADLLDSTKNDWLTWTTQAEELRTLRNDYAHGRWIFNDEPGQKNFRFARLNWDAYQQQKHTTLAASPAEIDTLSANIWKLIRALDDVMQRVFPLNPRKLAPSKVSQTKKAPKPKS